MGKHLRHKSSGITIENGHPGCMWSILHVIRYNQWNSVKKRLPHRRLHVRRSSMGNDTSVSNADYFQDHNDADMDNSVVEEKITQSTPAAKNSVRSRIRALIAEEISKKKGRHRRSATSPAQLIRTDSIHHLELSDQEALAKISNGSPRNEQSNEPSSATTTQDSLLAKPHEESITTDERCQACDTILSGDNLGHSPDDECGKQAVEMHSLHQETVDQKKQAWEEQKLLNANELSADSLFHPSKEFLDALDIIYLNENFFSKVLQDRNLPLAQHFHNQQTHRKNMKLTKSMSFPLIELSDKDDYESSKPKNKQHGTSYPEKGKEKLRDGSQAQVSDVSESIEFSRQNSMPTVLRVDGFIKPNQVMAEIADNSSPGSAHHMKTRGKNQVVIRRFKNLRQKIKHVIKESRNERYRIALDAIFHKVPRGPKFSKESKDIADQVVKDRALNGGGEESPVSSYKNDGPVPSSSKDRVREFRRTSSLNESLDRYCQLYESSCNREAKSHVSERVKSETKEADSPYIKSSKSLGRIASLPNLKCYRYRSGDSPGDVGADEQKSVNISIASESCSDLAFPHKSGTQEILADEFSKVSSGFGNQVKSTSLAKCETRDDVSHHEQDIEHGSKPTTQLKEPTSSSLISSNSEDDTTSSANISLSEDTEPRHLVPDELDVSNLLYETPMDTSIVTDSRVNLELEEILIKKLNIDILHLEVDEKDKAEFNYVRDVLRISGFSGNASLGTWHSDEQPVDPSVYEEMAGCLLLDPDCSGNEEDGNCNHLLLFDLINEVLVDIYLRSYTYCPEPLSSLCHIHPMPVGDRILKEVWENISWFLSSKPELDQSLDYLVTRDLAKGNGWMNLQFDTECVSIELEDLIFDDLMDEMLWDDLVDELHFLS